MSHVDKLDSIITDQRLDTFSRCAAPSPPAEFEDSGIAAAYDGTAFGNEILPRGSFPHMFTRTTATRWVRLRRGLASGRAHWHGPRCVNLAAVGPGFIPSDAEACVSDATLKRGLDIAASLLILFLALPVLLCTAIAVRLESVGPVLYRQTRVGRYGKTFNIYKFRTMRADAEVAAGPQWASLQDPRVTRIGGFLRRMRIDELPQLINVIKGEMSIVGPRPERPFFVKSLAMEIPSYAQRHHARPGITGWAQINRPYGASTEDAKDKLAYDLYYLKNSNFIFDILILLSTPKAVLIGKGVR